MSGVLLSFPFQFFQEPGSKQLSVVFQGHILANRQPSLERKLGRNEHISLPVTVSNLSSNEKQICKDWNNVCLLKQSGWTQHRKEIAKSSGIYTILLNAGFETAFFFFFFLFLNSLIHLGIAVPGKEISKLSALLNSSSSRNEHQL